MKASLRRVSAGLVGAALAVSAPALAAAATPTKPQNCFFTTQWAGWHAPNPTSIYLRVNLHDIYRVDLEGSSPMLTWPEVHLVNVVNGPDTVCGPLDLQLSVVEDGGGAREPLIAKAVTKLTPEQVAAIPKKDLP
jgi:hypothetical protein